jgi:hypothetical protein
MNELSAKFFDIDTQELDVSDKNVKSFTVDQVKFKTIRDFIEKWHYSKTVKGLHCTLYFGLFSEGNLIGAMMYGKLAMPGVSKKYVENEDELIELRRLCCIDKTPRNTESYFVGKTIKWIKRNTKIKKIISYADPHYGHQGVIYKASNFEYLGITSPGRFIVDKDGCRKHDKTIRNSDVINGVRVFRKHALELKEQLEKGEARYIVTPGKHIYMYTL